MHDAPECLVRRYKALDELIKELSSKSNSEDEASDPAIKLMCNFWNILKADQDCNLTKPVQRELNLHPVRGTDHAFQYKPVTCFMSGCSRKSNEPNKEPQSSKKWQSCKKSVTQEQQKSTCCSSRTGSSTPGSTKETEPLSKVLNNLNEAASFDRKCNDKISALLATQQELQDQIIHLEHREQEGAELLRQADNMWTSMEECYKKKLKESQDRQQELMKQMKDIEASVKKWRNNKKDLELQLDHVNKCQQEINETFLQKTSDRNCMKKEIEDYKKRIENNKKELEATTRSLASRRHVTDGQIERVAKDVARLEKKLKEEQNRKQEKEKEGNGYVKEAREDLQKLCKVLLRKKLENEDLQAEGEALFLELEMLKQTYDQCTVTCKNKQQSIEDEIKATQQEIDGFKVKCIQCHECVDTSDVRKFCTDCPRCEQNRECLLEGDHCSPDHTFDCVCMDVKQKFLDNVFDNMYTVLEGKSKSCNGKAIAETVMDCLKHSRNGKLNSETRKILQDFILNTIKKNLNVTIVGGAVKTRCEMDPETYNQLMLCLKGIKVKIPPKVDKGSAAKKEPCPHWGETSECNCPKGSKGAKECICSKRALTPAKDPSSHPVDTDDKPDPDEEVTCPYKESTPCAPDCGMQGVSGGVDAKVAAWRPSPCQGTSCQLKNMRAAQCMLGQEALTSVTRERDCAPTCQITATISKPSDEDNCKCGKSIRKPCACRKDSRSHPRQRMIEEVMGGFYFGANAIEKVSCTMLNDDSVDVGK
ncbi:uncharacterized protein LOC126974410 isoform X2 [Leptidea sinapis]|uniref:uncharacterized protein LOC126974410 isoform X2 n=1 Tax=Leptidea sinapis TaxID=189913 RepID=UPI0021C3E809|nr:uncharacterized protein LOC126974410 isoform X2 [Leptidea sinapis]